MHTSLTVPNCKYHPSRRWLGSGSSDALKGRFFWLLFFPHEFHSHKWINKEELTDFKNAMRIDYGKMMIPRKIERCKKKGKR